MKWTAAEIQVLEAIADAVEATKDMRARGPVGISPTQPEPFWWALDEAVHRDGPPQQTMLECDISLILLSVAHRLELDRDDRFWKLRAIVQLVLEHADLQGAPRPGKQKRTGPFAEADQWEEWIRANQLRALMQAKGAKAVSVSEWAGEMARRSLGLGEQSDAWTADQADEHIGSQTHFQRRLATLRKQIESIYAKHDFNRPSMRWNSTHFARGQLESVPFKWAPSDTELREHPNWSTHMKQLREQFLSDLKRRHGR